MPSDNFSIEIEGSIGELDYGGITLRAADELVEAVTKNVVLPAVKSRIHRVTGETAASVGMARVGFFNPHGTVEPLWKVYTNILHGRVLEYADGGKHSFMRKAARAGTTKKEIRQWVKRIFGPSMVAQIRNAKKRKRK